MPSTLISVSYKIDALTSEEGNAASRKGCSWTNAVGGGVDEPPSLLLRKGETLWLGAAVALTCTFLDLIYTLSSNPEITVFSVPFGATLIGAYTAKIIKVLDNRHKFVEPLPVVYVHAQYQRNIRFTDVSRWAAMGQVVYRFQEFAAFLSYVAKILAHLYPQDSLRQKPLVCSALTL